MLGMSGDDEEHPANNRAANPSVELMLGREESKQRWTYIVKRWQWQSIS